MSCPEPLKSAIELRIASHLGREPQGSYLRADVGLFDSAAAFAPFESDSLTTIEVLVLLGDELGLLLVDAASDGRMETFADLVKYIQVHADAGSVASFCQRWRGTRQTYDAESLRSSVNDSVDPSGIREYALTMPLWAPGFKAGSAVARCIPASVFERLGAALWGASSLLPSKRRLMAERHQRRITPSLNGRALRRRVRQVFRSYGRYYAESFRLPGVSQAELDGRMLVEGYEHLEAALDQGRGAIAVLPHLGSWEWGAYWLAKVLGLEITGVAERIEPPALFEWFMDLRQRVGLHIVSLDSGPAAKLLEALKAQHVVALVSDRDLTGSGVQVDLFGEATTLPAGGAVLALATGSPLVPAAVYDRPNGRHQLVIKPPLTVRRMSSLREDAERVTKDVAAVIEAFIRDAPEQWHVLQPNWPSDLQVLAAR